MKSVQPRLIQTYLTDGTLEGIRVIDPEGEIEAYIIPRLKLSEVRREERLSQPALYILLNAEIRNMERKNLAVEALQKLLKDEVRAKFSRNVVKDAKFSEMLNDVLTRYRNGTIEAAQVIEELIAIGQNVRQAVEEGQIEGMSEDEVMFYDALVENGSAKDVMGDDQLRAIAKVLVEQVRNDATIGWKHRTKVQAKLRVNVKKTLAKYGYPPDQQAIATDMVLEQAKRYGNEWSHKRAAYEASGGASLID